MKIIFLILSCVATGFISCKDKKSSETAPVTEQKPTTAVSDSSLARTLPFDSAGLEWSFTKLKDYLPEANSGFAMDGPPSGEDAFIGTSGTKFYSFARQIYKNGNMTVNVEIVDYLKDKKTFDGLLNMYGFKSGLDNNVLTSKPLPVPINGVKGLATVYKNEKKSIILLTVGDRFIVNVIGDGVNDIELLKKLAFAPSIENLLVASRKENSKTGV